MTNHVRQQIRDALVVRLTGLATTGANVFKSRTYALEDSELPCLLIANESDNSESVSIGFPRLLKRDFLVSIKAVVKLADDLDDALDNICKQVEQAICADPSLGGIAKDFLLVNTTFELNGDMEAMVGEATMLWQSQYYIKETAPDLAL
jgi:hypothetical protein